SRTPLRGQPCPGLSASRADRPKRPRPAPYERQAGPEREPAHGTRSRLYLEPRDQRRRRAASLRLAGVHANRVSTSRLLPGCPSWPANLCPKVLCTLSSPLLGPSWRRRFPSRFAPSFWLGRRISRAGLSGLRHELCGILGFAFELFPANPLHPRRAAF